VKRGSKIYTAFWMPLHLREAAKERAEQEGRTLSNYLIQLVREDLGVANYEASREITRAGETTSMQRPVKPGAVVDFIGHSL
jgi:hypothetical protein